MPQKQYAWLVTVFVNLGLLIFIPLQTRQFDCHTALVVTWVSVLIMEAVLLFVWKQREKKFNFQLSKSFYWSSGLSMLLVGLIVSAIVAEVAQPNSYTDLAASSISLEDIKPVQKRLVVEMLRKDMVATQANTAPAKNMKPMDPGVYSPASFANVAAMQGTVAQLQKSIDMDANYNAQLKQASDEFRTKMAVVDPAYLQDWDAKRKEPDAIRDASARAELLWWQSVQDLYGYAELHVKNIVIQDDKLGISDPGVRDTFNAKLDDGKKLYADWQAKVQADTAVHQKAVE